jgi:putative alpha-1,2-mannosidase
MKLKKYITLPFIGLYLIGIMSLQASYANKVNTLIGTSGMGWTAGFTWPGAVAPFGMVQFTPTYFTKQLGFVINQTSGASYNNDWFAAGNGSEKKSYIRSLTLNGVSHNHTWIEWKQMAKGGDLIFKLSEKPDLIWGIQALPPSYK